MIGHLAELNSLLKDSGELSVKEKGLTLIGLVLVVALAATTIALQYNQTAHVTSTLSFDLYIDNVKTDPQAVVAWGDLEPLGTYEKEMNVTNTGNVPINVTAIITGLPSGWTETWAANKNIIIVGGNVNAPAILTTPLDAPTDDYAWLLDVEAV